MDVCYFWYGVRFCAMILLFIFLLVIIIISVSVISLPFLYGHAGPPVTPGSGRQPFLYGHAGPPVTPDSGRQPFRRTCRSPGSTRCFQGRVRYRDRYRDG